MTTKDEILDALVDDGDVYKFDDGRELRLRIYPDETTTVDEDECMGQFAPADYRSLGGNRWESLDHPIRPDGFDGNAEILSYNRGERMWWQPPRGDYAPVVPDTGKLIRRGSREFDRFRQQVIDLLEFGYVGIVVELWHSCPTCGTHHEDTGASLWGIECFVEDDYKREVISDLLDELGVP